MTQPNLFQEALAFTLLHEGGYSNDPSDKGGATCHGITQKTYDTWRKKNGEFLEDVRRITDEEVAAIYEERYWKYNWCILLPYPLCIAVFDFSVNSGKNAIIILQRMVGCSLKDTDGIMGNKTLTRVREFTSGDGEAEKFTERYILNRMEYLKSLKQPKFERGWLNRCNDLLKYLNLPIREAV